MIDDADVLIVGAGMSGLCAALEAARAGARVIVLEKAPEAERGGNTRFSNGAIRSVYEGVDDIERLVGGLSEAEKARAEFGSYTREQYFDDLARVTQYRCQPELADMLIDDSRDTLFWLHEQGVRFLPLYEWQFKLPDGRIRFSGGSALEMNGAGAGASDALFRAAERCGVQIHYETAARDLIESSGKIVGVQARRGGEDVAFRAPSVVLCSGGFEANVEWRTRYLGPSWDLAKVRGSRFNTGDGLRMALGKGAMAFGNWSGCHSASWDLNAPDVNELAYGAIFKRDDYLEGVVVNADGQRFFDEGADIRSMTYAKLGRAILAQPGQVAWQIFDSRGSARLHGEYRVKQSARARADTLEELVGKLDGLNGEACLATLRAFNAAIRDDIPYDPGKKDGRCTRGVDPPKSNWATAISEGPFEAYAVTCGVTFTFGGLRIDGDCRVLDDVSAQIEGLYAAGEMVGGLFYFNYPGGSGLMSAAVFGRRAGRAAAQAALVKCAGQ
ncbi:MAG: tricarballylate dehydrogenase [Hyphomicrobiales bacterium]|nr:tricarballylate dehydrogenase [Hyphomicrobiales bacterium]